MNTLIVVDMQNDFINIDIDDGTTLQKFMEENNISEYEF